MKPTGQALGQHSSKRGAADAIRHADGRNMVGKWKLYSEPLKLEFDVKRMDKCG